MATVDGDVAIGDERSALAVAAEAESFQLTDDFEGERVVEFQHVDVVPAHPGVAERALGGAPATTRSRDRRAARRGRTPAGAGRTVRESPAPLPRT